MTDSFVHSGGQLLAERVAVTRLAERFGTPLWIYSADGIRGRLARLRAAFAPLLSDVHYSVKANSNLALLELLAAEGAGFDVVSAGEIERCRRAGIPGNRIVFAGVGKTDAELRFGLEQAVGLFDVESGDELARLASCARQSSRCAPFALRLNPDVDAGTHAYVTTGREDNKFGMPFSTALAALRDMGRDPALDFCGFHVHIGSQVRDPAVYRAAAEVAVTHIEETRRAGFPVRLLDLGGGFAVRYFEEEPAPVEEVAQAVKPLLASLGVELLLEPGRYLVAEAGILVTRVITVKPAREKTFVVVDAAMNDLIRPALYDARHEILFVTPPGPERPRTLVDVVGPICESGDFLAQGRTLPLPVAGELLAILSAGAYGMAMSSQYNSRPRSAEVLIDGSTARLIRRRETIEDLLAPELLGDLPVSFS